MSATLAILTEPSALLETVRAPSWEEVEAFLVAYWHVLSLCIMVAAVLILASSIDDAVIDVAYWFGLLVRFCTFWERPPRQEWLDREPEKLIALMVPAWREAEVIASMVANTNNTFDYSRYHIFVGVYANDADTAREVDKVRQRFPNVHRAEVPHDGPTSKADCLNWIIQNILLYETRTGQRFDAFLMQDAEDVVHPYGLKTVNWFIDEAAMIQTPVLSMDRKWNRLVACHYMDEFAEFHSKDLLVRSWLSGMTPSAGVGTAFHRDAMMALLKEKDGQPFNTDSLTEDYDVAHRLSGLGFRSMFVRYHARVMRRRKAWFREGTVEVRRRELVATKEFFPDRFFQSIRQKARWMLGISIMGWRQLGWFGGLMNRYYLARDRKALFTAPTGLFGYLVVIQILGFSAVEWVQPDLLDLPPLVREPWVWAVINLNLLFLINRVLHRAWFTWRNHGLKHVPMTPVRIVTSNLISFGAFVRASRQYLVHLVTRRPIAWDKTQHAYPSLSELQHGTGRIGEVLRFWNHVSEADLQAALEAQKANYRPLGLLLLDLGAIEDDHLAEAFAERGETFASMFDPFQIEPSVLNLLTQAEAARFGAVPLRIQAERLDVALAEPLPAAERLALEKILGARGIRSTRFLFAPLSDIAFAIRFAWTGDPFAEARARLAQMRESGALDASREATLWRSVRAGYARLGDVLTRAGVLSHADLQQALTVARAEGLPLGQALSRLGLVSAQSLETALTTQRDARWLNQQLADVLKTPAPEPEYSHEAV